MNRNGALSPAPSSEGGIPGNTIPVGKLLNDIRGYLKSFFNLSGYWILGEVSGVRVANGNCYFNLKDPSGQMSCAIWKSIYLHMPFKPEEGKQVLVQGDIDLYTARGSLTFSVKSLKPMGIGELALQLEELKRKLQAEGYFDASHKIPRPQWIEKVAIVTGKSTAALQDVMKTIHSRWPMLQTTLFPAPVQGMSAVPYIVDALQRADAGHFDAVLLVRGGGSLEDLFCFNDERIVRTIYAMKTYTVTGIGHEIDTSLADLAADHRALTPTAAAQWVTPDQKEVRAQIEQIESALSTFMKNRLQMARNQLLYIQSNPYLDHPQSWTLNKRNALNQQIHQLQVLFHDDLSRSRIWLSQIRNTLQQQMDAAIARAKMMEMELTHSLKVQAPVSRIQFEKQNLDYLSHQMAGDIEALLKKQKQEFQSLSEILHALSPQAVLDRGYAIVEKNGSIVHSAENIEIKDQISIRLSAGSLQASVTEVNHGNKQSE